MNVRSTLPVALAAAVVGGGVGGGAVALLAGDDGPAPRTVVQQAPLSASSGSARSASTDGQALTARDIYSRSAPGVVFIKADVVEQSQSSPFDFGMPQERRGQATGTGFVINPEGEILTNAHVIAGAVKITVQFENKKSTEAKVVGKDVSSDLALLKVDPDGLDLRPLPLGSSKDVQVGDPTVAIGNPFGLDRTLTTGVVSAKQRRIEAPNGFTIDNVIQTDAAINPGNSGGPLIDATGKVIGVNSQIQTESGGNVGIGFAVPIDTAKEILPQLEESGKVERAYLGVSSLTVDSSLGSLNLPVRSGALVQTVQAGSPAEKAGLRAGNVSATLNGQDIVLGGDIVVKIDGKDVKDAEDLGTLVGDKKPGDSVEVEYVRGKDRRSTTVKLGTRPSEATP